MIEDAILQGVLLCAFCMLAGGLFFERLVLTGERVRLVREQTTTARLRALSWALIVAFVAAPLAFVAARGGGAGPWLAWLRFALLLGLLSLLRARVGGGAPSLAALLLLGTQGALSRSAAVGVPALLGDWLHLTLAAFWLGGVAMLGVIAAALLRAPDAAVLRSFAAVIERFSPFAMFCAAGLALGGVAQSAQFLGGFEALWTTSYGRALSAKMALFVVLLGFGALHQQVLAPRLRRWALVKGPDVDGVVTVRRFRIGLVAEAAFGALLLAAVAVMKALPAAITP